MGHRLDLAATIAPLAFATFLLVNWFSPVPLFVPQTMQWQVEVPSDCNARAVEQSFPSGVTVAANATPSAPPQNFGSVFVNVTGPSGLQVFSGDAYDYYPPWDVAPMNPVLFSFVSAGGEYSFTACAVDGAPITPVFVNGSYTVSPVL